MRTTMPKSYISIFFLQPSKLVHVLTKIVNKSQPTLNNGANMTNEGQKGEGLKLQHLKNGFAHYIKYRSICILAFHFNGLRKEPEKVP